MDFDRIDSVICFSQRCTTDVVSSRTSIHGELCRGFRVRLIRALNVPRGSPVKQARFDSWEFPSEAAKSTHFPLAVEFKPRGETRFLGGPQRQRSHPRLGSAAGYVDSEFPISAFFGTAPDAGASCRGAAEPSPVWDSPRLHRHESRAVATISRPRGSRSATRLTEESIRENCANCGVGEGSGHTHPVLAALDLADQKSLNRAQERPANCHVSHAMTATTRTNRVKFDLQVA